MAEIVRAECYTDMADGNIRNSMLFRYDRNSKISILSKLFQSGRNSESSMPVQYAIPGGNSRLVCKYAVPVWWKQ